jgi:hypothetical protein
MNRTQRRNWEQAAKKAGLKITGYNLFTYWQLTHDRPTIRTVERQSGIPLVGT